MKKRINPLVFGGAFDPFHLGHLGMIGHLYQQESSCRDVIMIPTGVPVHKESPMLCQDHRLAMLHQVIASELAQLTPNWRYHVDCFELDRLAPSFMVDTLKHLDQRVALLIGADQFFQFHRWKNPEDILSRATLVVAYRQPSSLSPKQYWEAHFPSWTFKKKVAWMEMPAIDISSQGIREKIMTGASIDGDVAPSILADVKRYYLKEALLFNKAKIDATLVSCETE